MTTEQLTKLLRQLKSHDAEEGRLKEAITLYLAGACSPETKQEVEAMMAADEEFHTEMEEQRRQLEALTPSRLAGVEEQILLRAGVRSSASPGMTVQREHSGLSSALLEVFSSFCAEVRQLVAILAAGNEIRGFSTEGQRVDSSAIARTSADEDGIEILVVSSQPERDEGARIEAYLTSGRWRETATLRRAFPASREVRASFRISQELLASFPEGAEIRLHSTE